MSLVFKKCNCCGLEKDINEFRKDKYKDKIYIKNKCRACENAGFSVNNKNKNLNAAKHCLICNIPISYRSKTGRCRKCINFGHTSKKWVNSYGYILIYHNKKRLLEHRVIMENHIGRKLFSHESVHHKNGNRADNRLENLEIWSTYQPHGQRIEDKIKYAKEILAMYEPMALRNS